MRLLVLFDLPVVTKAERRAYTLFRRFLMNDGYDMIQFSVYGRILNGNDALEKHMKRLVEQPAARRLGTLPDRHRKAIRQHETSGRPAAFSGKSGQSQPNAAVLNQIFQAKPRPA